MRPQSKTKSIIVSYKGWHMTQTPWNSWYGKQYAKRITNPEGKERLHAGYSKHLTRKKLRLDLINWVNKDYETLIEKGKTNGEK